MISRCYRFTLKKFDLLLNYDNKYRLGRNAGGEEED